MTAHSGAPQGATPKSVSGDSPLSVPEREALEHVKARLRTAWEAGAINFEARMEAEEILDLTAAALTDLEERERKRDEQIVEGVLDLMSFAGSWEEHPDTIRPYSNGYACWFVGKNQHGTAPLKASEILRRVEARAALATSPSEPKLDE